MSAFHLFERFGVELEYMIVAAESLDVLPVADRLLADAAGATTSDVERGPISWSNEIVNHVIELKTTDPTPQLEGLEQDFAANVAEINERLATLGGRLMPSAMHPWMNPQRETRLWPHENSEVYAAFDRVFNCKGHGWSNLQSVHINLPFADDAEFARLHAAIRLILPILPALAASSPVMDSRLTGLLDNRLDVYRNNCARIPSVTGRVIPEPVFSQAAYEREVFRRMFADIAPFDPDGVLQEVWLNARGAIARFDRGAIEIRVLDIQECTCADLAIARCIVAVLQALSAERWCSLEAQQAWPVEPLAGLFLDVLRDADQTTIAAADYLGVFGMKGNACTAAELWLHLIEAVGANPADASFFRLYEREGPLARRIVKHLSESPSRQELSAVYGRLCECLADNAFFDGS